MRPVKRRKLEGERPQGSLQKISELEEKLKNAIDQRGSLNALTDLLGELKNNTGHAQNLHKALYALYRTFSLLIYEDYFHSSVKPSEEALVVRKWVLQKFDQYLEICVALADRQEPPIYEAAVQIPLSLLKTLSSSLSKASGNPQIHSRTFRYLFPKYLSNERGINALAQLAGDHDDVRWFTLREIAKTFEDNSVRHEGSVVDNALQLLEAINMPKEKSNIKSFYISELSKAPKGLMELDSLKNIGDDHDDEDDWRKYFDTKTEGDDQDPKTNKEDRVAHMSTYKALHSLQSHKAQFSAAWLALLQHIKTSPERSSRVLTILHRSIMPHLVQPIQLMDWIVACVDFEGAIALLAFNALFVLIQEHNLDYPDFYTRLYASLDRNILHVRYRARFFRLLELFLSSTHLPATILASFAKRLARLSLHAPPAAIIMVIPFIYNILKRHPSLMGMIHRIPETDSIEEIDPYLPDEPSPLLTNAISSSLWEIQSHRTHYAPPVATMARIFSEPFTKPSYVQEDFLDHTYGTMFTSETKRKIAQDPALQMTFEGALFNHSEDLDANWEDLSDPCQLWA
ncbi:CBF-domain-containing protein [Serendipita vermifera]|nr:CBF-domain-containing protein [Serendipita vermifera]